MAKLIFIGTSGRSGSYGLAQALNLIPGVEAHHQYACVEVQRIGTLWYRKRIGYYQAMAELDVIYGAAARHCRADYFIDVSNKLPWVMDLLKNQGTLSYIVRDGKKVCLSYYHKLPEVYAFQNMRPLMKFFLRESLYAPPPEERYWWPYLDLNLSRWELLCWHWQESYNLGRGVRYKFESLLAGGFQDYLKDLGLPASKEAEDYLLSKPHNVIEPKNYEMNDKQAQIFESMCGELYHSLGYTETYDVSYLQPV